jgi:KDO2-lipid IV(A) lauroyltransferase
VKDAPILHRLEYAGYRLFRGLLRLMPHTSTRRLGRAFGSLGHLVDQRHRRVALDNLALALPEISEPERRRIVANCFRHFGAALFETISAGRFDGAALEERLTLEGWEHLEAAESAGKGMVLLGAHLGVWEICAQVIAQRLGPMDVVVRPLDNPYLDAQLIRERMRNGNRLLPKRGAARAILKAFRGPARVGILIDQRVHPSEGIEVPFFGEPAWTSPLLARVSLRTGAPVVPIFCVPLPGGRYRFVAREPIWPGADGPDEVERLTRRYLEVTEQEIRRDPAQWLWFHRRWRH